jgi:hypothetical protein
MSHMYLTTYTLPCPLLTVLPASFYPALLALPLIGTSVFISFLFLALTCTLGCFLIISVVSLFFSLTLYPFLPKLGITCVCVFFFFFCFFLEYYSLVYVSLLLGI